MILGNKSDLEAVVSEEEAEALALALRAQQLRCSARQGHGVAEALRQLAERLLRSRAEVRRVVEVYGPPPAAAERCCVLGPEGFKGAEDREEMAERCRELEERDM